MTRPTRTQTPRATPRKARASSTPKLKTSDASGDLQLVVVVDGRPVTVKARPVKPVALDAPPKVIERVIERVVEQVNPEHVIKAVQQWMAENMHTLRGKDGDDADPVTAEQIAEVVLPWLTENIKQPENGNSGRDPTFEEISLAVALWMEFNADMVRGKDGEDADPVTQEQIAQAVDSYMAAHPIPEPEKPQPGNDGAGIDRIEQPDAETVSFILTTGRRFNIKLPRGKEGPSSSGANGLSVTSSYFREADGHLIFVVGSGAYEIDAGEIVVPPSDFTVSEYLPEQPSLGAVLTFTFSAPMQQVWVEMNGADADEGRARIDGLDPTPTIGTILRDEGAVPITATTSTVKVLAPTGARVNVWGYRR